MLKEYAPDIRERRGFLGLINRGVKAKGFERTAGYVKDTPGDFVDTAIGNYRKSDAGRAAKRGADQALEEAKRGASRQKVVEELEKAKIDVTKEGQLDNANVAGGMFRGRLVISLGSTRTNSSSISAALENVRGKARELKIGNLPFRGEANVSGTMLSQQEIDREILQTLKKIEQATAAAAKSAEKKVPAAKGGPPAPIPGPAPGGPRAPGRASCSCSTHHISPQDAPPVMTIPSLPPRHDRKAGAGSDRYTRERHEARARRPTDTSTR